MAGSRWPPACPVVHWGNTCFDWTDSRKRRRKPCNKPRASPKKMESQVMFPAASADRPGRRKGGHCPARAGKVRRPARRHSVAKPAACSPPCPRPRGMQPGMYLSPAAEPGPRARLRRSRPLQGRVRLHRAPPAGARRTAQRPRRPAARPRRRHPRRHPQGPGLGARHASASPTRIPNPNTRRWSATRTTSPNPPARASSTR